MSANRKGFTIAEVLVAVVMLSVGVMALVGSSAMVTRMVGRGRVSTYSGQVATARVERLRQIAASTANPCTSADWKTDSVYTATGNGSIREKWRILDNAGNARRVQVTLSYASGGRAVADTITTTILCQ
jgi:prepilin-type N-terminal cleavage/methylation domain-containing protein